MAPLNVHPPDPRSPKGMAFIMGAGFVDPRNGKTYLDREPMALTQSWEPTSELWWDLGLRWHPELATKWLKGGGQFAVAEIVDEKPVEPTMRESAEQMLDFLAGESPEFVEMVKKARESGDEREKAALLKEFEKNIKTMAQLAEVLKDKVDGGAS